MYQSHWGLTDTPFSSRLDPRFFHESPTHEEALARLHFLVDQRRRLGLLLGGQGSGKSLLLEVFAAGQRRAGQPVAGANLLGTDGAELLWLLASQFGLNPPAGLSSGSLWRLLTDRLTEYRYQQLATVLLLDNADRAGADVLMQITRIAQFDSSADSRLTLVLSGRQERMGRIGNELLELAELRIDIGPWGPADTEGYLSHALAQAGRTTPIFAEAAVLRLHELGDGVPRRISQLADLALLAGAGGNLDRIDVETIESVYRELGVIEV
jgi:general secretion pathway protein A